MRAVIAFAALLFAGCGDDAKAPPATVELTYHLRGPMGPGVDNCSDRVIDSELSGEFSRSGPDIFGSCRFDPDGDRFRFQFLIKDDNETFPQNGIRFEGEFERADHTGASAPCTFWIYDGGLRYEDSCERVLGADGQWHGCSLGIDTNSAGEIYGSFECDDLVAEGRHCSISTGGFHFTGCK